MSPNQVACLSFLLCLCFNSFPHFISTSPVKVPLYLGQKYGEKMKFIDAVTNQYEEGNYFEGDLAIPKELIDNFYGSKNARIATAGIRQLQYLWPNCTVIYQLDPSLSNNLIEVILSAMKAWSSNTCIQFKKREDEWSYVNIKSDKAGCYSDYIGFSGMEQTLNLETPGCMLAGIAMHELGHHLGLWHEQSRPDRDNYVRIIKENIEPNEASNFEKRSKEDINTQNLEYDYSSIMHYPEYAFSRNGMRTIEVSNMKAYKEQGYPVLGQRVHLSSLDIAIINKLYSCPKNTE